jgi:hypothetical protein
METCCDAGKLLRTADYRSRYDAFTPPAEVVEALQAVARPVTVLVVFGLWCRDSARIVPEVLKSLALAENPNLQLLAVHVSYEETDPSPFMAGPIAVRRYPTVAFLEGRYGNTDEVPEGKELVRFVEESLSAERITAAFA